MREMLEEAIRTKDDAQHGRYLTFRLEKEVFGIEIGFVTEIVGLQEISDIPESPDFVRGVINLRGEIISVIDMRLKFKKSLSEYTDRTCIIVIGISNFTVGLIVDNVDEVISIPDKSIVPPPSYRTGFQNKYIKGIGKTEDGIRLLLDCDKIFSNEELNTFNKSQLQSAHLPRK